MEYFTLGIFFVNILLIFFCVHFYKDRKVKNDYIEDINQSLASENAKLHETKITLVKEESELKQKITNKTFELTELNRRIESQNSILNNSEEIAKKAFESYCDILENSYKEKDNEYDTLIENMRKAYEDEQIRLLIETEDEKKALEKIRELRTAASQAILKEKEIKEQLSFYCLQVSEADKDDISRLNRIKPDLHNPRILSMLIWQTYLQKQMTALCNNILGTTVVTGIYKITNQTNNLCYIGQSRDIATRWKDHAKCGTDIDRPQGNKLYKAMVEDGIWNFSWELLEACSKEDLDEKEAYYIDLYNSKEYGYNTLSGTNLTK